MFGKVRVDKRCGSNQTTSQHSTDGPTPRVPPALRIPQPQLPPTSSDGTLICGNTPWHHRTVTPIEIEGVQRGVKRSTSGASQRVNLLINDRLTNPRPTTPKSQVFTALTISAAAPRSIPPRQHPRLVPQSNKWYPSSPSSISALARPCGLTSQWRRVPAGCTS